ncbi:hypothetical protein A2714_01055 [Candidatus Woesebacteria bacterium RIFCSPHIGHO2_01_FULL_38_9]|uniref:Uncharacterized protein n=2 Tax=Candidatus Woeseibacteriota TaxID=1752722 RepID=A0A1F7Y0F1_9BACT|nr:MAG: hypothetical protein A2714_01055 [Candidatus Woesebacteria bacterium RIFCSPHIGHO2_01_FULL_38_9]OGM59558.1 MAG: hypothetical protein A3A75_05925 [Candidatus Woesebacteria bacterium RIFCSPLOWO2_01_FULL_39_10]
MSEERGESGIWVVRFDPSMPERDTITYNYVEKKLSGLPLASRYRAMSVRPMACIMAVDALKRLQPVFSDCQSDDQWVHFDRAVIDHYGFKETGQDMLSIRLPKSENQVTLDVAGYLFGFPFEEMLVTAGGVNYLGEQATEHYRKKYPDITVSARMGP